MSTYATFLQAIPWIAAVLVILVLSAIGLAIWITLPHARDRNSDIDRQIATLRKSADHSVDTRPRVRAGQVPPFRPAPQATKPKPKACGRGLCRHQDDCSDIYCPGRVVTHHVPR